MDGGERRGCNRGTPGPRAVLSRRRHISRAPPKFAEVGTRVVDNSSHWRMDPTKKLVVPEINGDVLEESDYIIANPNCSTIQMLLRERHEHTNLSMDLVPYGS